LRIMGGRDAVTVTTHPPITGYEAFTLNKGSFVEFQTKTSFVVEADGPILVGHYMIGSNYPGFEAVCTAGTPSGIGDPALTLVVPEEQYLSDYVVLTPPGYAENYINVVGPQGVSVTIDGQAVEGWQPVGDTGRVVAQVPVAEGVHTIQASQPVGLTAYGYDCDVSYAYPGGLQLQTLGTRGP